MNEVWKKPPVSFEAYQAMVGKEIGVSSWHLVDQKPDRRLCRRDRGPPVHPCRSRARQEGNRVRHHRGARLSDDVAAVDHVLRGDAGHRGHHDGRQLRLRSGCASCRRCARARRVRGRFTLLEAKLRKPKELQSRTNVTVEIEGEAKPALVAELDRADLFRLTPPSSWPGLSRPSIVLLCSSRIIDVDARHKARA